ncbi:MAG TPA: DegT/DnrJ/EryC1/StrS family aminotransferase [Polyangiales bacterium]|nr:DegT/DnrJ/EryC1/StrS family aminotransferase [Polyangiales bacterium]
MREPKPLAATPTASNEPIPLLDLNAQSAAISGELRAAFERVLASGQFILGPELDAFEREIASYLGAPSAFGVSSGTDALVLALMALEVGPGDEVIAPTFSFFATAGAIARLGAKPVFVDIEPHSFNLDVAQVEAKLTPRTKAIIPVDLFGQTCDLERLLPLAEAHHIPVVEDAAQALGAASTKHRAGVDAAFGCYSFFPSKNLGALGDGGLLTVRDPALAKRARILRAHGAEPKYHHALIGGNFRLDALQAAFLRVKLPHLARWTASRQENARLYDALFAEANLDPALLQTPARIYDGHVYNQYVIRTPRRDALQAALRAHGIGCEVYYPIPLHLQECFAYLGERLGAHPVAERAAKEALALPIYAELGAARIERVVRAVVRELAG